MAGHSVAAITTRGGRGNEWRVRRRGDEGIEVVPWFDGTDGGRQMVEDSQSSAGQCAAESLALARVAGTYRFPDGGFSSDLGNERGRSTIRQDAEGETDVATDEKEWSEREKRREASACMCTEHARSANGVEWLERWHNNPQARYAGTCACTSEV